MPEHIRAEPDIRVFIKLSKTHRFNLAFSVIIIIIIISIFVKRHKVVTSKALLKYTDILYFIVCDSWNAPIFSM